MQFVAGLGYLHKTITVKSRHSMADDTGDGQSDDGADLLAGDVEDDDDVAVAPSATATDNWATAHLSICHSSTYQVPVLYFNVFDLCQLAWRSSKSQLDAPSDCSPFLLDSQPAPPSPSPRSSNPPSSAVSTAPHTPSRPYQKQPLTPPARMPHDRHPHMPALGAPKTGPAANARHLRPSCRRPSTPRWARRRGSCIRARRRLSWQRCCRPDRG